MIQKRIKLDSVQKVIEFNKEIQSVPVDIDIRSGRIEIDAKSIMGLFALDLSKPLLMLFNSSDEKIVNELFIIAEKYEQ